MPAGPPQGDHGPLSPQSVDTDPQLSPLPPAPQARSRAAWRQTPPPCQTRSPLTSISSCAAPPRWAAREFNNQSRQRVGPPSHAHPMQARSLRRAKRMRATRMAFASVCLVFTCANPTRPGRRRARVYVQRVLAADGRDIHHGAHGAADQQGARRRASGRAACGLVQPRVGRLGMARLSGLTGHGASGRRRPGVPPGVQPGGRPGGRAP
jgi:hypothetical protein